MLANNLLVPEFNKERDDQPVIGFTAQNGMTFIELSVDSAPNTDHKELIDSIENGSIQSKDRISIHIIFRDIHAVPWNHFNIFSCLISNGKLQRQFKVEDQRVVFLARCKKAEKAEQNRK